MTETKHEALFQVLEEEEQAFRAQLPPTFAAATMRRVERRRRRAAVANRVFAVVATAGVALAGAAALWFFVIRETLVPCPTGRPELMPGAAPPAPGTDVVSVFDMLGQTFVSVFGILTDTFAHTAQGLSAVRDAGDAPWLPSLLVMALFFLFLNLVLQKRFHAGKKSL